MLNVNEYFEGNVKSIAIETAKGPATIGAMEPGTYKFNTAAKEKMVVVSGSLTVLLPEANDWVTYTDGQDFDVPAESAFDVKVDCQTAYLCYYG